MKTPTNREELETLLLRLPNMTETRVHDLLTVIDRHGLAIVPKEPTEEMARAGYEACNGPYAFCSESGRAALNDELRAAIAAAPFSDAAQKEG